MPGRATSAPATSDPSSQWWGPTRVCRTRTGDKRTGASREFSAAGVGRLRRVRLRPPNVSHDARTPRRSPSPSRATTAPASRRSSAPPRARASSTPSARSGPGELRRAGPLVGVAGLRLLAPPRGCARPRRYRRVGALSARPRPSPSRRSQRSRLSGAGRGRALDGRLPDAVRARRRRPPPDAPRVVVAAGVARAARIPLGRDAAARRAHECMSDRADDCRALAAVCSS